MKKILIASFLAICTTSTFSSIEFYNGDNGTGRLENILDERYTRSLNLKNERDWNNDEIRSLRLKSVAPGTIIRLYDNPDMKRNDDWIEIRVKKSGNDIVVGDLEKSNYHNSHYTAEFHRVNGLNGKVSAIEVIKSDIPAQDLSLKVKFERAFDEEFTSNDKQGRAYRFNESNSNYRQWKPTVTERADGGIFLSMKIDHIRGQAKDDYALVKMQFNKKRQLVDLNMSVTIADDKTYTKTLNDLTDVSSKIVKSSTKNPKALAAAEASKAIMELGGSIYTNAVGAWADRGGRGNFKNVISHKANDVVKIINSIK